MGIIIDILKEIPLSAVLREKIIDLEKKMSSLEAENLVLKAELQKSKLIIEQQIKKIEALEKLSHNTSLNNFKMQWGCLLFAGDNKLYCPSCFHVNGKKIETSRVDTHNRYCAVCKIKIPSG